MDGGTAKVVECPITQLLEKLGEPVIDPVIIEYLNGILSNGESLESYDESAMQAELRCAVGHHTPKPAEARGPGLSLYWLSPHKPI